MSGGERRNISVEGTNTQLHRQVPEPQCNVSYPSQASQLIGKMPTFSIFSEDSTQHGEVSFELWAFEVKECEAKSHGGNVEEGNSMVITWSHS